MTRARQQLVLFDCVAERSAFVEEVLAALPEAPASALMWNPEAARTRPPRGHPPAAGGCGSITTVVAHCGAVFGPGTVEA